MRLWLMLIFSFAPLTQSYGCPKDEVPVATLRGKPSVADGTLEQKNKSLADGLLKWIDEAPDARFYVLPEAVLTVPHPDGRDFADVKEAMPYTHPAPKLHEVPTTEPFDRFAERAKKRKAFLQIGFLERGTGAEEGKVFNAAIVFGPDGKVHAKHRKVTPAVVEGSNEKAYVTLGAHSVTAFDATSVGLGRVGVAICADLYDEADVKDQGLWKKVVKADEESRAILDDARKTPHLMEKYRAADLNLVAISADWLAASDPEEGYTKGWSAMSFFNETAEYLNHSKPETTYERYPKPPMKRFAYKQRTDRNVNLVVSNTIHTAPAVGVWGADGKPHAVNTEKKAGWTKACLPEVKKAGSAKPGMSGSHR